MRLTRSEDLGNLVLMLADHGLDRKSPELPECEREQIDLYFSRLEHTTRLFEDGHIQGSKSFSQEFELRITQLRPCIHYMHNDARRGHENNSDSTRSMTKMMLAADLFSLAGLSYGIITGDKSIMLAGGIATAVLTPATFISFIKYLGAKGMHEQIEEYNHTSDTVTPKIWEDAFRDHADKFRGKITRYYSNGNGNL